MKVSIITKNELNKATEQYLSKGASSMNIYNKVTLSVILVITILISFTFYYFNKEDKPDKDDLYENKIANRKSATSDEQKRMVSLQTMLSQHV